MIEGLCVFNMLQELQINGHNIRKIKRLYVGSKKKPLLLLMKCLMDTNKDNLNFSYAFKLHKLESFLSEAGCLKHLNL